MPLFPVKEDTLLKAFTYAASVIGISTALVLEYRAVDPFKTYKQAGDGDPRAASWSSILQTALVSAISTFLVLWALYFLFGFGQSFVLAAEEAVSSS